jgi:aspartyl/glutamyl-tRNA(Asn/Gln) amidotransferase C subunit
MQEQELRQLAHLCRIHFEEEQLPTLASGIQKLLDYVQQIQELDTSSITDYTHPFESWILQKNLLADAPVVSLGDQSSIDQANAYSREQFLANTPDQIAGMVRVPNMQ